MKSQIPHTVRCNITGEAAEEIWHWSLLGVKGLKGWENVLLNLGVRNTQIHSARLSCPWEHILTDLYVGLRLWKWDRSVNSTMSRVFTIAASKPCQASVAICSPNKLVRCLVSFGKAHTSGWTWLELKNAVHVTLCVYDKARRVKEPRTLTESMINVKNTEGQYSKYLLVGTTSNTKYSIFIAALRAKRKILIHLTASICN